MNSLSYPYPSFETLFGIILWVNICWNLWSNCCGLFHLISFLYSLSWIWLYVIWDLAYDIVFIISFFKLIPLVLWKCFICYQGTLPLSFIYSIPWTCIFIYSQCLITSCYVLITSLILDLSRINVVCIIRHLLYYTCWTNPIILWKHFELQLRYVPSLFLYAWFHLICMSCVSNILLIFCSYHFYPIFDLGIH